jgi:glycosyltransferase involved in cell wall biosynthesis
MSGRRPITVAHFTNALARGGVEEHVLTLVRGLDRGLFRAVVISPEPVAALLKPDLPADVALEPLTLRKPTQAGAFWALARILRRWDVDVLHSHQFYASLFASPAGWLCRVPVIVETPHVREYWRQGGLKGRFFVDRVAGRFVDRYIAVSEANGRYLGGTKRLPADKITVIHNGSDLTRFDPNLRPPEGLRTSLRFGASDPVLLVLGRLEPQKGHRYLLDAMPAVLSEFPNARLVCAGDGSLAEELKAEARTLGVDGAVRFVGFQQDVSTWLALADLTVLPSLFEGLPLVAIESLAAGRPMVATAVDGTPEIVVDGMTGLTVPPADSLSLADAIRRMLRDGDLRRRMGEAGRRWVQERFSQQRQVQETEQLYLRLLRAKAAHRISEEVAA